MITSVELSNFLSHSDTKLEFDNGVTVFVGHNGAGKSSIIDAITFALFGQHTRNSNKGLIKHGEAQGFTKVIFSINGKRYKAERRIDVKGGLAAQFSEMVENQWVPLAAGERKQFSESMTHEVEKRIGLDFEKLKIASIVQQGELNAIIKAKPKEFKELLNAIIGIDKLDVASEAMKEVSKNFRQKIEEQIGYDDTHIDILSRDLQRYKIELAESKPLKDELSSKRIQYEKELAGMQKNLETDLPKLDKLSQLESRKNELSTYAKEAIQEMKREIAENERKIRDCKDCFESVSLKKDLESKLEKAEFAIEDLQKKLQHLSNQKTSLEEKHALSSKLQLKDNKCPVCDSVVDKLNPLFQEKHLKQELAQIQDKISGLEKELVLCSRSRVEFSEKVQKAGEAEAILRTYSIKNKEELQKIQHAVEQKKVNVQKVLTITAGNLVEVAHIDSHTKILFDAISQLEHETQGFDEKQFAKLKESIRQKQSEIATINQRLGAISEKIDKAQEQIKSLEGAIFELKIVRDYVEELDTIQTKIFNRDGPVATSLRSWALNTISSKASE
ncbi:MAG: SMC family ATPase, partial [Nitrosopumilaceae archaeon]|nr:SMC family ATPase [Nitrosopumilaceae archaeon]